MPFDIEIINSIGRIAVSILILLSLFLITVDSQIKPANRVFACFLALLAFDMFGLFMYGWLVEHPYVDMLRRSSALLQMPLVYFYVKGVCFKGDLIGWRSLKHSLLFFTYWLTLLHTFVWLSKADQMVFLQNPSEPLFVVFSILSEAQYYFYIYLIFRALNIYKQNYQANFTNYDATAHKWLLQLSCISLAAHLIASLKTVAVHVASPELVLLAHLIVSLSVLSVICWLVLSALYHPSITRGIKTEDSLAQKKHHNTDGKLVPSKQTNEKIQSLEKFMQSAQLYLDPDLNIEKLAVSVHSTTKEVSTLINQYMGTNFFNYVNAYRIEQAKSLLKEHPNRSVLEILYEVGFNSKSSFNTAFKKHSGQTPSAYRKAFS